LIFRGNPEKFCEFAFPTIDKNKNGQINFSEFMTAVALTHPGDTETRLHLVRNRTFISTNFNILFALRYFLFVIMIILERSMLEKSSSLLKT
jgi:hypothetical protein